MRRYPITSHCLAEREHADLIFTLGPPICPMGDVQRWPSRQRYMPFSSILGVFEICIIILAAPASLFWLEVLGRLLLHMGLAPSLLESLCSRDYHTYILLRHVPKPIQNRHAQSPSTIELLIDSSTLL